MKTIPEKQKKPFTVTVEDAVRGDGKYTVLAYDKRDAINVCKREHNIQNSQSGTTYSVQ
jgi:hypothetical protein